MMLIDLYLNLGEDFMKSFYSTSNISLSAYMGEQDGCFAPETVMARSEVELQSALDAGFVDAKTDGPFNFFWGLTLPFNFIWGVLQKRHFSLLRYSGSCC